jgi:hypothetical protein
LGVTNWDSYIGNILLPTKVSSASNEPIGCYWNSLNLGLRHPLARYAVWDKIQTIRLRERRPNNENGARRKPGADRREGDQA